MLGSGEIRCAAGTPDRRVHEGPGLGSKSRCSTARGPGGDRLDGSRGRRLRRRHIRAEPGFGRLGHRPHDEPGFQPARRPLRPHRISADHHQRHRQHRRSPLPGHEPASDDPVSAPGSLPGSVAILSMDRVCSSRHRGRMAGPASGASIRSGRRGRLVAGLTRGFRNASIHSHDRRQLLLPGPPGSGVAQLPPSHRVEGSPPALGHSPAHRSGGSGETDALARGRAVRARTPGRREGSGQGGGRIRDPAAGRGRRHGVVGLGEVRLGYGDRLRHRLDYRTSGDAPPAGSLLHDSRAH